ncbi:MAG: hypothetical protein MUO40_13650, partial [Anaerolineaceae bacterium]|nr:hypothetical protein [Anaerolineaceae bacterium]
MIILVPIVLLLVGALAIVIINRKKTAIGITWIIAAGSSFVSWVVMVILRLFLPTTLLLINWEPESLFLGSPMLVLDYNSWPYSIALITIALAVIFTDSTKVLDKSSSNTWAGSLAITAIGLLSIMAGNPLTMVLAWAFVDVVEIFIHFSAQETNKHNHRIILLYGIRLISIILFIWATMVGWLESGNFDLDHIPTRAGIYFLLSAGLRLGVIPFNLPFFTETDLKGRVGNLLRLAPVASGLSLIAHMPTNVISIRPYWLLPIQILITISAVYAASMWVYKESDLEGRPYWIIAFSALAIASAINGNPEASRAWGLALLLPGSLLFLFKPAIRRLRFLLILGVLGIIALPLTPAASGWQGLIIRGVNFWNLLLIFAHALLVLGYIRHIISSGGAATGLEFWSKIIYPLGLVFLIQTFIGIGLIGWPGVLTTTYWWGGVTSLGIVLLILFIIWRLKLKPPYLILAS